MTARSGTASAIAAVAAVIGYALLGNWLMLHAADRPWSVAVLFGPLLLALGAAGWQRRQGGLLLGCAGGAAVLALAVARGGIGDIHRMYVLQHAGIHAALGLAFGLSLRPGNTPLITAMAQALHHRFTASMQAYTRWLTGLWAAYFGAMVVASVLIYGLAPWSWWSVFGNLLTPLLAGTLFVVEHIVRYRRHPEFERVSLRAVIQAYRALGVDGGPR